MDLKSGKMFSSHETDRPKGELYIILTMHKKGLFILEDEQPGIIFNKQIIIFNEQTWSLMKLRVPPLP